MANERYQAMAKSRSTAVYYLPLISYYIRQNCQFPCFGRPETNERSVADSRPQSAGRPLRPEILSDIRDIQAAIAPRNFQALFESKLNILIMEATVGRAIRLFARGV